MLLWSYQLPCLCLAMRVNKLWVDEKSFAKHCWTTEQLRFYYKISGFPTKFYKQISFDDLNRFVRACNETNKFYIYNCFVQPKLKCSLFIHLKVISKLNYEQKIRKTFSNVGYGVFFCSLCSQHSNIFVWNCNWQRHTPHHSCTLQ